MCVCVCFVRNMINAISFMKYQINHLTHAKSHISFYDKTDLTIFYFNRNVYFAPAKRAVKIDLFCYTKTKLRLFELFHLIFIGKILINVMSNAENLYSI